MREMAVLNQHHFPDCFQPFGLTKISRTGHLSSNIRMMEWVSVHEVLYKSRENEPGNLLADHYSRVPEVGGGSTTNRNMELTKSLRPLPGSLILGKHLRRTRTSRHLRAAIARLALSPFAFPKPMIHLCSLVITISYMAYVL